MDERKWGEILNADWSPGRGNVDHREAHSELTRFESSVQSRSVEPKPENTELNHEQRQLL
jgi:hypothetical protein